MLLNNFGNTCYINSVLQIFLNNYNFKDYIQKKTYPVDYLLNYFKNITDNNSLRNFLIKLQEKLGTRLNITEQNDTAEIYTHLIDIFEKEDETCIEFFKGMHRKTYKCLKCKHKREMLESFININLYITEDSNNLQIALMKQFEKETLNDPILCDACSEYTRTEVKNKIIKWPTSLIFCINRSNVNSKINIEFEYTRHIELLILNKISKYTITGLINHIGTKDMGHYTYIKISKDCFIEIDDDKIRHVTNFKSLSNYMLVYNLIN